MIARILSFFANGVFALLVLGAAVPGTHRVAMPGAYGLTEIAPRIWTDAPSRADGLLSLVEVSRARVIDFFGDATRQNIILCSTQTCARTFRIGGNGLSIANFAVMVSPGGLTRGTLTHELVHSRLHRSIGFENILRPMYPTWFDEGLATYVAGHPNWQGKIPASVRKRVLSAKRTWHWGKAYREVGVRRAYGVAAAEVASIERRAGRTGLMEIITRAEAGEKFATVLIDVLAR
ncbi:hypothetical protein ROA7745_02819 [Roseovarius aestuarii]|uniref:Uncharacterized protein n=1 Tax=Roseovarius aestuarii TaxID=475083 RepID=A0A1X7BTR6_9RHOB|nr:hypothetical protein ROA7745_02819 [Roseovarius aestuarii]